MKRTLRGQEQEKCREIKLAFMLYTNHNFSRSCDCHVIGLVCREVLKQLCEEGVSTGILEERVQSQFAHELEDRDEG